MPRTLTGKLIGTGAMVMGIFFIAMPLTIIGSSFAESWDRMKSKKESDAAKLEQVRVPAAAAPAGRRVPSQCSCSWCSPTRCPSRQSLDRLGVQRNPSGLAGLTRWAFCGGSTGLN